MEGNITYNWEIGDMEVIPSENDLTNVVRIVHWRVTANDGINSAYVYSSVILEPPSPENFMQYETLQYNQVLQWAREKINADASKSISYPKWCEQELAKNPDYVPNYAEFLAYKELERVLYPKIIRKPAPWTAANN